MSDANTSIPYRHLGGILRRLREEHSESVAEVSGAVEIDENDLAKIESGNVRPPRDILMLLISHFGIEEDPAEELWQLAGYEHSQDADAAPEADAKERVHTMMIMLDPRVMYSDSVEVTANKQGLIVGFAQSTGFETAPLTVSRIGMSYEQARGMLAILQQALHDHDNPGSARRLSSGPPSI